MTQQTLAQMQKASKHGTPHCNTATTVGGDGLWSSEGDSGGEGMEHHSIPSILQTLVCVGLTLKRDGVAHLDVARLPVRGGVAEKKLEKEECVEERPYRNQRLVEGEEQRTLPQSRPDSESTVAREGQPTDREGSEGVEEWPYDKRRLEEEEQANPPTESTRQRDPKVLRSTNAESKRRSK
ncbi:hypothetical protein EDB83DRAFT_2320057 [Lactarius deliciosus]|nr:hypothetical protein EDB83DRAFT_2320057 [Lactarius deliciosus]